MLRIYFKKICSQKRGKIYLLQPALPNRFKYAFLPLWLKRSTCKAPEILLLISLQDLFFCLQCTVNLHHSSLSFIHSLVIFRGLAHNYNGYSSFIHIHKATSSSKTTSCVYFHLPAFVDSVPRFKLCVSET